MSEKEILKIIANFEGNDKEYMDRIINKFKELSKYKEANKKAVEYIKHSKNKRVQLGVSDRGLQEFEVQDLLKILEGVEDE